MGGRSGGTPAGRQPTRTKLPDTHLWHSEVNEPLIECRGLRKSYGGGGNFVLGGRDAGISFNVASGELFALLGPSGCGKTTTLRIIGGFLPVDAGRVVIQGNDVTGWPPYRRPTNTVFQSYALFPHMSVGANVAFGLSMEGIRGRDRRQRVAHALELVGLGGFQKRRVSDLSGGQQQRAALARALVKRPAVLLLDEPLGSLDLRLRKQMQDELVRLKTSTSTGFVHVTHDQEEACAIADRVGIMNNGNLIQVDEPFALYRRPRTTYVATFLDAGTVVRGPNSRVGDVIEIRGASFCVRAPAPPEGDCPRAAVIPPDRVRVTSSFEAPATNGSTGTVTRLVFTGTAFLMHATVGQTGEVKASLTVDEVRNLGETCAVGARVHLAWDPRDVILVDDSEEEAGGDGEVSRDGRP
jgi:ABC-type Fe3+/spermidine/putrescine transport system ATPase subunit